MTHLGEPLKGELSVTWHDSPWRAPQRIESSAGPRRARAPRRRPPLPRRLIRAPRTPRRWPRRRGGGRVSEGGGGSARGGGLPGRVVPPQPNVAVRTDAALKVRSEGVGGAGSLGRRGGGAHAAHLAVRAERRAQRSGGPAPQRARLARHGGGLRGRAPGGALLTVGAAPATWQ